MKDKNEIFRKPPFEEYQNFLARLLMARDQKEIRELQLDDEEERAKLEQIVGDAIKARTPAKTVTFQVTDDCNLRCTYCYQINKGKRKMPFEVAKRFIDILIEDSYKDDTFVSLKTTPGVVVEFICGEPLLEIELIEQIYDYFRWKVISENHPWANNHIISMISNGVEYFNPKVQAFLEKHKEHTSFGISLDGCKPLHDMCRVFPDGLGSYDIAEAGCIHYKKHFDPRMLTKMTIAPENITWTFEAFENLVKLGYTMIHANCVYEKGWQPKHGVILYDQLKKVADYILENDLENDLDFTMFSENSCKPQPPEDNNNYCGSTGCMLACDPDGLIAPCIRFMKSSLGEQLGDFTIGNTTDGIGQLEKDRANIELLDSITRRSQSTDECFNCPVSLGCGWCTAYNYQETGSANKRCTYICWTHRARSLANVYYWNKVYQKNNENKEFPLHLEKEYALQLISEEEYNMLLELVEATAKNNNHQDDEE
jgi:radical SAM peptide maturase (CXXX-repeat target family)